MSAYQPKTGAKCGCRRGVQRDNCPRCEGTGMVIDFKAIREKASQPAAPVGGAQFTSGPWVMRPDSTIESKDGVTVASFIDNKADMPLIAAAPAMYGALLQVREMLLTLADNAGDVPEWNTGGEMCELAHIVRTALAQAEGRQG